MHDDRPEVEAASKSMSTMILAIMAAALVILFAEFLRAAATDLWMAVSGAHPLERIPPRRVSDPTPCRADTIAGQTSSDQSAVQES
jgi:hypothetical protein